MVRAGVRDVGRVKEVKARIKDGLLSVPVDRLLWHNIKIKGMHRVGCLNLLVYHKVSLYIPALAILLMLMRGLPRSCPFARPSTAATPPVIGRNTALLST